MGVYATLRQTILLKGELTLEEGFSLVTVYVENFALCIFSSQALIRTYAFKISWIPKASFQL